MASIVRKTAPKFQAAQPNKAACWHSRAGQGCGSLPDDPQLRYLHAVVQQAQQGRRDALLLPPQHQNRAPRETEVLRCGGRRRRGMGWSVVVRPMTESHK